MKAIELLEKLQSSYPYPKVSEEDFVFSFMKLKKQNLLLCMDRNPKATKLLGSPV